MAKTLSVDHATLTQSKGTCQSMPDSSVDVESHYVTHYTYTGIHAPPVQK